MFRPSVHSESLFTDYVSPKKGQARNQWQNCRIGQPSTKKLVFLPDQFGLGPEVKGKLGEIRSLLETLGGSLYPRKKIIQIKPGMDNNFR